ncbi:bifunctional oligoribonuclease/PAP phosphatase NrnA [Patescibacteria group bacterium]|nr:bifunctional oligoribonuclease/PAP phosphatase NrnA [Patescibacteria group bacterium]MBU0879802.1 bifunctional oligoribonuclease/PAP phosphatase NrnA [Patescibacteria group bacterium]MBU0880112.1 bifunctional oligoribonuclease/PAP phosphatase NrnA [Patescibacteria group bacterium]MBU1063023.1 bifunctional oligoribonuclease/PAP phosphatase NrnA [Patescibacteria group bacterium]MBU1783157.1 bifunctional oligoribonuclease/PAP phosphatase NrnA [Patescibacteria group bacterium]
MDNSLFQKAYELIKQSKNILLVTHEKPDGDAIASACAMAEILELNKKSFTIFCPDKPPFQYDYLPHLEKFSANYNFNKVDLIIILDCGSLKRTNLEKEISERTKNQLVIEFDHHPKMDNYADIEFKLSEAASTTEILYQFLKINKIKINKNLANCILTGIITDTANFLYPSTSSQTINISSEMLSKGAKLPQIMENTKRNKSLTAMKMWGKAMSNLKINKKYNFAVSILSKEDIDDNITEEDIEGISGFLSNLENVSGLMLLREQKDGNLKGSLRTSNNNVNISQLARLLGGGGHAKASGFTIEGKLEKINNGWKIE